MEFRNVKLIYFSPTQTTQKVLESIANGMGVDIVEQIDLTYPKNAQQPVSAFLDELVIIGAPVYAGRLPAEAVARFKQLRANHTLAIIVVVYGNREFDDALLELKNLVSELGFTPIVGGAFVGEHSFSTKDVPIAEGRPDCLDVEKALKLGQKIKDKIKNLATSNMQIALEVPGNFPYKEAMPANVIAPIINENFCNACGTCVDVCPTGAIFVEGTSILTKVELCIRCCACVKSCPNEARVVEDASWKAIGARLNANCSTRKEPQFFGIE